MCALHARTELSHRKLRTIKGIIIDLYKQEDILVGTDSATLGMLGGVKQQQANMQLKLQGLGIAFELELVQANRVLHLAMQSTHDSLVDNSEEPHSVSYEEMCVDNPVTAATAVRRERRHFTKRLDDGSMLLTECRLCLSNFLHTYRYNPDNGVEKNESNRVSMQYILEHDGDYGKGTSIRTTSMRAIWTGMAACISSSGHEAFKHLPETLIFDRPNLAKMQRTFELQLLVVTTTLILLDFAKLLKGRPMTTHHTIDAIARHVKANELGFNDIEKLVAISYTCFKKSFKTGEHHYDCILDAFEKGLVESSGQRLKAQTALRAILWNSDTYEGEFNGVKTTVETFRNWKIPIEATCIAPLMHEQGRMARNMIALHGDVHDKLYSRLLCDSVITLFYEFP
jgi:hypothetical protein